MPQSEKIPASVLSWLLEPADPAVRYLALRDLAGAPADELAEARRAAHCSDPIALILSQMEPEGYWDTPSAGYSHKYHSTVWSLISLAQSGASMQEDERLRTAVSYYLDHAFTPAGQIGASGTPASTFDCLQGNMLWSLTALGCRDERLDRAYEWMARSVTGEGIAPYGEKNAPLRYIGYKRGPDFACGANGGLPCAWGAEKVLLAFGNLPPAQRTPLIEHAIRTSLAFLLSTDPAGAAYPADGGRVSPHWWQFGFPVYYTGDVLQVLEALVSVGVTADPRMANAVQLVRQKQDENGRWPLEYSYTGKNWGHFGTLHRPSKWITLRALRVLQAVPLG